MQEQSIGVLIAARDAERTIGSAVRSALRSNLVTEVIVVSDGSTDATGRAAVAAAGGDGRLRVLTLPENVGPAEARNRGISVAQAEYIALLDADDEFLPGRLEALVTGRNWDLIADNVVFVSDPSLPLPRSILASVPTPSFEPLSLAEFVGGNVSQPGRMRSEYGFLKPVISRSFLLRTGLRYDRRLRLGEDYDFYVRALMAGGRFLLTRHVGYLAHVRAESLSSRHGTADLRAFAEAIRAHSRTDGLSAADRRSMRVVLKGVERRHAMRSVLDAKAERGLVGAVGSLVTRPHWIATVTSTVLKDKLPKGWMRTQIEDHHRLLLPMGGSR